MKQNLLRRCNCPLDGRAKLTVFAGTVCLLLLTCCASPKELPSSEIIQPVKHPVVNLVLIGIREDLSLIQSPGMLPLGSSFTFNNSTPSPSAPWLLPTLAPRTAAGTVMNLRQLSTWFAELEACGSATSYVTLQFSALPDRTASVSKQEGGTVTSNWSFDQTGGRNRKREISRSGAVASVTPTLTEDPDVLKIALSSHVSTVQIKRTKVAHGIPVAGPGLSVPLEIDLTIQPFQDLNVEFSLEYDHAIIMAHQITRTASEPAIRRHVLYLAALARSPAWPKEPPNAAEPLPAPRDALALYWPQSPDEANSISSEPQESPDANTPSLKGLSRNGLDFSLYGLTEDSSLMGMVAESGCAASFAVGRDHDYVCGLTNYPSSDDGESTTFDRRTARSGMRLQYIVNRAVPDANLDASARLAGPPQMLSVTEELPSPRKPRDRTAMETFSFQAASQHIAEFKLQVSTSENDLWEAMPAVRTEQNGMPLELRDTRSTTSALLFYQRAEESEGLANAPTPPPLP